MISLSSDTLLENIQPCNLGMDILRAGNTKQIGKWDQSGWKISSINKNLKSFKGMLIKYLSTKSIIRPENVGIRWEVQKYSLATSCKKI